MNDIEKLETLIDENENERLYWESLRRMYGNTPIAMLAESVSLTDMKAGTCAAVSCRSPEIAYLGEVFK